MLGGAILIPPSSPSGFVGQNHFCKRHGKIFPFNLDIITLPPEAK